MNLKIALIIAMMMSHYTSFCQEDNTLDKPKISQEILGELTEATGWVLNFENEWVSGDNTIPLPNETKTSWAQANDKTARGLDNFIYYQLRNFTYKGNSYYILLKKTRTGFDMTGEWENFNTYDGYIFSPLELEKITKQQEDGTTHFSINLIDYVYTEMNSEEELIAILESKIDLKDSLEEVLKLAIILLKEDNKAKFQFYTEGSNYDTFLSDNEVFDHGYYETTYEEFNKLFKLNK